MEIPNYPSKYPWVNPKTQTVKGMHSQKATCVKWVKPITQAGNPGSHSQNRQGRGYPQRLIKSRVYERSVIYMSGIKLCVQGSAICLRESKIPCQEIAQRAPEKN